MPAVAKLKSRYEIQDVLDTGGMGVVYRAYDRDTKRLVALKTIRDALDGSSLDLFRKECEALSSIIHPNIVEIYDIGEIEEGGVTRPYFVMPLLPGATLDKLIKESSQRLTIERSIEIIAQTCRGLQAAHERGLIHRDLKPSNIFILDDDSVKIIDFGVAHLIDHKSSIGLKGTLPYMAPEQIERKKPSPQTDLFSLAVVCYEVLARRRPFHGRTQDEVAEAICRYVPPAISEFNPGVSPLVSQIVHKAMAKQPWARFATVREFGELLQKALRNEPIDVFDMNRVLPRIQTAKKAFAEKDYDLAGEILMQLESEGFLHPEIATLRRQVDAASRSKTITLLCESARRRFAEGEDQLALQKLHEVLEMEPGNADAITLKNEIENRRSARQIEDWFRLAKQHLENQAYQHARQALQNVLHLKPQDSAALHLLSEVDQSEQEYLRMRQQKEQMYQAALEAWHRGEVSAALGNLERVLELDRRAPDTISPERGAEYQSLYNQVRTEHDRLEHAYSDARRQLADRNFAAALEICQEALSQHPQHALFQALKFDIEEQQRQEMSAYIARLDREVDSEPDLNRRVSILEEALRLYPGETHFEKSLQLVRAKRDLVHSIVAKAHNYEAQGQFSEALGQWEILRNIYGQQPGLAVEIERLHKRRNQQARSEAKARWVEQIDRSLSSGDYARGLELCHSAQAEFPGDPELNALERISKQGLDRMAEAQKLMSEGQALVAQGTEDEGLTVLRQAYDLDPRNAAVRGALVDALAKLAKTRLDNDWRTSEQLSQQALDLDPHCPLAKSVRTLALDRKHDEIVTACLAHARELQAAGRMDEALAVVDQGLAAYPKESRLLQFRSMFGQPPQDHQQELRRRDWDQMRDLERGVSSSDDTGLASILEQLQTLTNRYQGDVEFQQEASRIERTVRSRRRDRERAEGLVDADPSGPSAAETLRHGMQSMVATKGRQVMLLSLALAGTILLGALVSYQFQTGRRTPKPLPPTATATYPVRIHTQPPGAAVRIIGNGREQTLAGEMVQLPEATYRVVASLDGYETAEHQLTVTSAGAEVMMALPPARTTPQLALDIGEGTATLDGQPVKDLVIPLDTSKEEHVLNVSYPPANKTEIRFRTRPGALPELLTPVADVGKSVRALVVSGLRDQAKIYSSYTSGRPEVDSGSIADSQPGVWDVKGLPGGQRTVKLLGGKQEPVLEFDAGRAPLLMVHLRTDNSLTLGGLLLQVELVDGLKVSLNGKEQRWSKSRQPGTIYVWNLEPKEYTVRVEAPQYDISPKEQKVSVKAGQPVKLAFAVKRIPQVSRLVIRTTGASAQTIGAQVSVDRTPRGTIQPGQDITLELTPGRHRIELTKRGFRPSATERNFEENKPVELTLRDFPLERITGTLVLTRNPENTSVSLESVDGDEAVRRAAGARTALPEGEYRWRATAAGHTEKSGTVRIAADRDTPLDVRLEAVKVELPKPPALEGEWEPVGKFYSYKLPSADGTYSFNVRLAKKGPILFGGGHARWYTNVVDDRNYVQFDLDKKKLVVKQVSGGRETSKAYEKPHELEDQDDYRVVMSVSGGNVSFTIQDKEGHALRDAVSGLRSAGGRFAVEGRAKPAGFSYKQ